MDTPKTISPLNDESYWFAGQDSLPPCEPSHLEQVQKELDSILGITRDGASIAKIVWNGDVRYWKQHYRDWDQYGKPIGGIQRRPWVLYKTVLDKDGKFAFDAYVPRYIVLTRLEPEQFADSWAETSTFYCPERQRQVQYKPETPPSEVFLWFATIAEHRAGCCQRAAQHDAACYGLYADPRAFLEEARQIRKGMEGMPENTPFDSPDKVAIRMREQATNNYGEQALRKFNEKASFLLDEAPLLTLPTSLGTSGLSLREIKGKVRERIDKSRDALEQKLKQQGAI